MASESRRGGLFRYLSRSYQLYLLLLPALLYLFVYRYVPIYGLQIAFKDYSPFLGFADSPWVGFRNFTQFFESYYFVTVLRNTIVLSLLNIAISFPFPIVLALLLNQLRLGLFKRFSQTVYYAPFFLSKVVLVGMIFIFFSPRSGLVNQVLELIGFEPIFFMGEERWFRPLFVASGVWQETGWKSIIFLGALTAVSPELHESAIIDGASRFKRILYIDLPSILPTIMIILILSVGRMMTIEFDKTYLMQTPLNLGVSEVIQTFVYKRGLIEARYSFATAVGLFNSVVNFAILLVVNRVAGKLSEVSLW